MAPSPVSLFCIWRLSSIIFVIFPTVYFPFDGLSLVILVAVCQVWNLYAIHRFMDVESRWRMTRSRGLRAHFGYSKFEAKIAVVGM